MKSRMSALDIRCSVEELRQRIIGTRVANIYDVNSKTYLLKFSRTDEKILVVLESGVRVHITEYGRDKGIGAEGPKVPSGFTMRLRRSIRMKKLIDVKQLGVDRVIQFSFAGDGEVVHLFLELYSQGNLIITDDNLKIATILRTRRHDESVSTMVGDQYDTSSSRQFIPMSREKLDAILQSSKATDTIKQALNMQTDYGPHLVEHCLVKAGIKPSSKIVDVNIEASIGKLLDHMQEADRLILNAGRGTMPGYIILKTPKETQKSASTSATPSSDSVVMYEEFHPVLFAQFESSRYIELPSFAKASDEFFSKLEAQKIEQQRKSQEDAVMKKLEKTKHEHQQRIKSLQSEQESNEKKATLIEYNLEDVDRAILVIRSFLAQSMDWEEVTRIWKEERKKGNPIASMIHQLKFELNQITVLLSDNLDDATEEELTKPATKVDVDLSISAYANACRYFDMRKKAGFKQQKTIESTSKAMKAAEHKTNQALKQVRMTAAIKQIRKPYWFEKFQWFITSENFLVIAGRDAQQNEMIVKKYLGKNDVYVHADIHGASSCVVKNHTETPIPPLSLTQAGTFCVCLSAAWTAKILTSAYWVYPNQVSKTAPTGEYLTTGSFMIRGKKNYLPPTTLAMGFGFLFKIDESCLPHHVNDRVVRSETDVDQGDNISVISDVLSVTSLADSSTALVEDDIALDEVESDDEETPGESSTQDSSALQTSEEASVQHEEQNESDSDSTEEENDTPEVSEPADLVPLASVLQSPQDVAKSLLAEDTEDEEQDGDKEEEPEVPLENPTQVSVSVADQVGNEKKEKKQSLERRTAQEAEKSQEKKKNQPLPRGKKGKMKKLKTKYADQSDEERELRMALLQSAPKKEEKKVEKPEQKQKGGKSERSKQPAKGPSWSDGQPKPGNDKPKQNAERDEIRRMMEEENIAVLEEEDKDKVTNLNVLVESPLPEDILLYAIPVCGPYSAMQRFKYKVKATPGSMKKGKAVKAAVDVFSRLPNASTLEKELMKHVSVNDMSQALISDVKLSAPGLQLAKAEKKKAKKAPKPSENTL